MPYECVDGAKCTVPASPELALEPDLFDVVESDVIKNGGLLKYKLSLSTKPTTNVNVTVALDIRTAPCYAYDPKFELDREVFYFSATTYNFTQEVNIHINRLNESSFEGTFSAYLQHTIETEDEIFQSAFLRPVSVTFQDDSPCPSNAQKYDFVLPETEETEESRVRRCGCVAGFFISGNDPLFCDSITECTACPPGMTCIVDDEDGGQILQKAQLEAGWYRLDNSSINVVVCPEPQKQCLGNATSGNDLCTEGHEGGRRDERRPPLLK